jgi:hemoglobin-like flavoprotein
MTPRQIEIIRATFALAASQADTLADRFYDRLFALRPDYRALFPSDVSEQKRKLVAMLSVAVAKLDQPEVLVPALLSLGRRHAAYGVTVEHFQPVGQALIETLDGLLGEAFDAAALDAWLDCFALVQSVMGAEMPAAAAA